MSLSAGTRLGPYEITALLGTGGMGEVYRATDTTLGRQVAIKVLPEAFAQDPERLARFEREAKTLATLNHPNIAQIYGVEKAQGTDALVMELVEGPTLAERIQTSAHFKVESAKSGHGNGLPLDEALPIAKQIAEALEAAHEQGIIHRDLKPANIKVRHDGTVKVLDFGLAKLAGPAEAGHYAQRGDLTAAPTISSPAMMTGAGMILGTAAYMAPEQARGKAVDKRADIWAFGCVLFEMLTGQRAFEDEDVSLTLSKVLQREPDFDRLPATVPGHVRQTLRLCLRKPLKERIPDIGAVRLALDGAFESGISHGAAVAAARPVRRRVLPFAAGVVVASLAVGLAAWSLWPTSEPGLVGRFAYELPDGQTFSNTPFPVIAVSPDGRSFVYNAAQGLYLRRLDELEARLIPGTEGTFQFNPFFSPDGESVGYYAFSGGGEWKRIAIGGGAPVVICEARALPYGASWGRDDTILFGQSEGIMRVRATGGTPELVIRANEGEQVYGPQLLPDGDSVLFSVTTATGPTRWDEADVVVQSLRTGERTVVLRGGSDARYVPTGHLVYALRDVLYATAFDAASLTVIGGPVPIVQGVQRAINVGAATGTAHFSLSDRGALVYLPRGAVSDQRTLALVGRNGVPEPLRVPPAPYLSPRLSPDGRTLVVQTQDQGNHLWTYDLTSDRQIQQLTFEGDNHRPVWTPDGKRITFASDRDGPMSLYWMSADGSGVAERLTTAEAGTSHWPGSWSPDGQTLLFNVQRELATDWDIWTLSMNDREMHSLYDTPRTIYLGAELSPDGKWLAYGAGPVSSASDIYVEPFPPTGARRRISQGGGLWPLWSRTGDRLFYRPSTLSAVVTLKSVDVATRPAFAFSNEQTLPIEGFQVVSYYRDYDITPDGERLLMVFPAERATDGAPIRPQIIVVQNFFEELRRLVPTP